MSAIDIPPHSRSGSRAAVLVLALIAAGAFAEGFLRQGLSRFEASPPSGAATPVSDRIPDAVPIAPTLQLADAPPAPKPHRAPPPVLDLPDVGAPAAPASVSDTATDASATAPAPPEPPAPAPANDSLPS